MTLSAQDVLVSGTMKMPIIGLGTWQSTEEEIETAIDEALLAGYRHIDTAYVYLNEGAIGKTLEKWFSSGKLRREDVFIVTKLPNIGCRPDDVERFLKKSLQLLKLNYVDLYLIHHPVGFKNKNDELIPKNEKGELDLDMETDHIALWKAMETQVEAGRTSSIGLSNFTIRQINRIIQNCHIKPANIQVEMHVYLQQNDLLEFCGKNNISICAYAPIGSPQYQKFVENIGLSSEGLPKLTPMNDPVVLEVAKSHNKTPSQILLRFLLQQGVAVIPKSTNPGRIKENFQVFNFELSPKEMDRLRLLDKGKDGRIFRGGFFTGMEAHPEFPY